MIFGRRIAAEETGLTERQIRTALQSLRNLKILTIKTTNKFSIITIINWNTYQAPETENDQQNDQHATSNRPHTRTEEHKKNISVDLYQIYLTDIAPSQKTKQRALKNIQHHLKKHSFDDLKKSVQNYKSIALTREPAFRKDPANFFGKQEPAFVDYLPENYQPAADYQPPKQPDLEELFQ